MKTLFLNTLTFVGVAIFLFTLLAVYYFPAEKILERIIVR